MKKIIKTISLVMVVLVAVGVIWMSIFMGLQVSDGLTKQNIGNDTKGNSVKQLLLWGYDTSNFEATYEKNSFFIKGDEGYDIPVVILGGQTLEEKNTVILIHGLGGDYVSVYPQAEFYLKNNYNVITYDQRGGGDSSDENIYFGYYEKEDLKSVVNYVRTHISDQKLVVHGFSLGAVTAGLYSATEHAASNVDVLIMDSAFDSMEHVFLDIWPDMKTGLPGGYAVWCGNIALKLQYHFGFKDNDLTLEMGSCTIPTLLIQGEKDDLSTPVIEKIVCLIDESQMPLPLFGKDDQGGHMILQPEHILYFESVDKKSFAYTKDHVFQIQPSLNELEMVYKKQGFVRINKSSVVNIYHVKAIKPEVNMRIKAVLVSGESLLINRSYKKTFESFLKEKRSLK